MQNGLYHAAERLAFQTVLNKLIKTAETKDAAEAANSIVSLMEKILGDSWSKESYENLRYVADHPDSKWARYADRIIRDTDPHILSTFLLNAAYEGGFRGYKTSEEMSAKYDCNIPWIVLMDPTSACNMHCTGCWAAEYGHKQNLSYEVMDKVLTEGKELGIHACLFTGGEPLIRKKDIIKLCEKHKDVAFHAFTNSTLIDDEFCQELLRVGNFFLSLSIEGFESSNDGRRGDGHFDAVMKAMDLMHSYKIPFGVSICYTSKNYLDVTSDEFLDMIIEKGCAFAWYFHYMPVGMNATTDLLLTPEQRMYMKDRVRWIRDIERDRQRDEDRQLLVDKLLGILDDHRETREIALVVEQRAHGVDGVHRLLRRARLLVLNDHHRRALFGEEDVAELGGDHIGRHLHTDDVGEPQRIADAGDLLDLVQKVV